MIRPLVLLAALLLAPLAAPAHEIQAGDLEIIHPAIPRPPAGAPTGVAYMVLTNHGDTAERLLAVEIAVADRAGLHRTEVSADGVARMVAVDSLEIPPGETIVLEPGGLHLMLYGLKGELSEGEMVPARLIFERAGAVDVTFMVDPRGGADHSGH